MNPDVGATTRHLDLILTDPDSGLVPASVALSEALAIMRGGHVCRVRVVALTTSIRELWSAESGACAATADAEMFCRVCGAGGPCCDQHEARLLSSTRAGCQACGAKGKGADLFAFVPIVPVM